MHLQTTEQAFSPSIEPFSDERELHRRISAEFREMPGLVLTLSQAARLFSVDVVRCEQVLGALVERGILAMSGRTFLRSGTGRRWA